MLSSLPSAPGVYWFLDDSDQVLYVGKAKDLKRRVGQYTQTNRLNQRILRMVKTASHLKYQELGSELEALLVEAELIRLHQPDFNILLKDDKSPLYLHLTPDPFPQLLLTRKHDLSKQRQTGTVLGPFQSAYRLKEVLKLVRPIFPWCSQPPIGGKTSTRACFYYHLQLCPGVCVGKISAHEYQQQLKLLVLFLRGKTNQVTTQLQAQMLSASTNQNYEQAARIRDQIELIKSVTKPEVKLKPDAVLPQLKASLHEEQLVQLKRLLVEYIGLPKTYRLSRIEGYDVSNTQGQLAAVALVTCLNGEMTPAAYRSFNIKTLNTPNDYHMLKEALLRRQNHPEWGTPDLVVIDGGKGQLRAALSVWATTTPIISIAKNPDRIIIPTPGEQQGTQSYKVLTLNSNHPGLQIVQRIRDEAHRFSKKQHSRRRTKHLLNFSKN